VDAQLVKRFESVSHLEKVRLPEGASVKRRCRNNAPYPDVLYAEPNYIVHAIQSLTIPNDPHSLKQWNLHNTGQNGGTGGSGHPCAGGLERDKGSTTVVLAITIREVDYTHPDLSSQIWSASSSFMVTRTQGDVFTCPAGSHRIQRSGWKLRSAGRPRTWNPCCGITARGNEQRGGSAGINWNIQILPCKFINSQGFGDLGGAMTCLDMVKSLKDSASTLLPATIAGVAAAFSQALSDAIAAQQQAGMLSSRRGGNDFLDNDLAPGLSADYAFAQRHLRGASTNRDEFARSSNVGRRTTHLAAPGDQS